MSTRNFISMQHKYSRVVLLVDMDCFFCQVEEKLDPKLKGQPLAVVQYNAWRGGGIIAVNYAARAKGVTRHMRGDEAKEKCPEIVLARVPNLHEKADLSKYRDAGKEVANVLQRFTPLLERASVDEAYLDISELVNTRLENMNAGSFVLQPQALTNTYAVGYSNIGEYLNIISARMTNSQGADDEEGTYEFAHDDNDLSAVRQSDIRLLVGASIAAEVRAAVKAETGYECSAGIAHNKILAKLACGINKPNKQTILPLAQIPTLFATLPVGKITGLGGKFGEEVCERMGIRFLGELVQFSKADLQKKFDEKNGTWLYQICRGIDLEAVTPRFYSKSIGCCKKFPGRNNITGLNTLKHWLTELASEICYRLEKDVIENNRRAKQMVVSYIQEFDGEEISSSRSAPLRGYEKELLAKGSLELIQANTKQFFRVGSTMVLNNPIKFLGISVGKFETITNGQNKLQEMFANQTAKKKRNQEAGTGVASAQNITNEQQSQNKSKNNTAEKKKNLLETFLQNKKQPNNMASVQTNDLNANTKDGMEQDVISNVISTNNEYENAENFLSDQRDIVNDVSDANEAKVLISDNIANIENVEQQKENKQPFEQSLKKSFFLNAIKKQSIHSANFPATTERNIEINEEVEESKLLQSTESNSNDSNARSKSFFANILPKTKCTTTSIEVEKHRTHMQIRDSTFTACERDSMDFIAQTVNSTVDNSVEQLEAELKMIEAEKQHDNEIVENAHLKTARTSIKSCIDNAANEQQCFENETKKRKYTELSARDDTMQAPSKRTSVALPSTACGYQSNYVEYAVPELRSEHLQFSKCAECGAKVLADEVSLQTHRDHHIALQLSQHLRDEYRAQLKNKSTLKSPPTVANKKSKTALDGAATKSKDLKIDIKKFLKPRTAEVAASVVSSASVHQHLSENVSEHVEEFIPCTDCHLLVKQSEFVAHKDFHVAKELQRKLNLLEVRTVTVAKKSTASSHNTSLKNTKPITQFFSQPKC